MSSSKFRPNQQSTSGSFLDDPIYSGKGLTNNKNLQNTTLGLFNKGNGVSASRIASKSSMGTTEAELNSSAIKSRTLNQGHSYTRYPGSNNTPVRPLASSTKENIFPTYEPVVSKTQKMKVEKPEYPVEPKLREQEYMNKQNSSLMMSTPKQLYNENIMQTYEEKRSNQQEKLYKASEQLMESSLNKMLPPRPSSKAIVRDAISSIKESEKQSNPNSSRTTASYTGFMHGNENINSVFVSSYNAGFDAKKRTLSSFTGNSEDREEDSTSTSMISQEPRGLVGLKNIGNTCFM